MKKEETYYANFTDEQIDALMEHRRTFFEMIALSKAERLLTERLGKLHSVTTHFRLKYLIPAKEAERKAQAAAEEAYEVVQKIFKERNAKKNS